MYLLSYSRMSSYTLSFFIWSLSVLFTELIFSFIVLRIYFSASETWSFLPISPSYSFWEMTFWSSAVWLLKAFILIFMLSSISFSLLLILFCIYLSRTYKSPWISRKYFVIESILSSTSWGASTTSSCFCWAYSRASLSLNL